MTITESSWAKFVAVLSALAGVVGTIITPIYGATLGSEVQDILQAVCGVLLLFPGLAATSLVHAELKARIMARVAIDVGSREVTRPTP